MLSRVDECVSLHTQPFDDYDDDDYHEWNDGVRSRVVWCGVV